MIILKNKKLIYENIKEKEKKEKEEKITSIYVKKVYNFMPNFKEKKFPIPDCYFEYNNIKYAVEVTRYYSHNKLLRKIECSSIINKIIESDNLIECLYRKLGKYECEPNIIIFNDINDLKNNIFIGNDFIDYINIGNNYYYNKHNSKYGSCYINGIIYKKNIKDFLLNIQNEIINGKTLLVTLKRKNKFSVSIKFKYSTVLSYGKKRSLLPLFSYFENQNEIYNNILKAIQNKICKLFNYYIQKTKEYSIYYNYYDLVVYYEVDAPEINCDKLYALIKNKIDDIGYHNIAIFVENSILVINKDGYKVYFL